MSLDCNGSQGQDPIGRVGVVGLDVCADSGSRAFLAIRQQVSALNTRPSRKQQTERTLAQGIWYNTGHESEEHLVVRRTGASRRLRASRFGLYGTEARLGARRRRAAPEDRAGGLERSTQEGLDVNGEPRKETDGTHRTHGTHRTEDAEDVRDTGRKPLVICVICVVCVLSVLCVFAQ